jgi:hypothetical protein
MQKTTWGRATIRLTTDDLLVGEISEEVPTVTIDLKEGNGSFRFRKQEWHM